MEKDLDVIVLELTNSADFYELILPKLTRWYKETPFRGVELEDIVRGAIFNTYCYHGVTDSRYAGMIGRLSEAIWDHYKEEVVGDEEVLSTESDDISQGEENVELTATQKAIEQAFNKGATIRWRKRDTEQWFTAKKSEGQSLSFYWRTYEYVLVEKEDPFAKLKKAHEEGKRIQYQADSSIKWSAVYNPGWYEHVNYRIHPDDVEEITAEEKGDLSKDALRSLGFTAFYHEQPKETKIMKSIKIESQTNIVINDQVGNATSYSDEQIFSLITDMEKEIETLEKTKNQPKKLKAELARMTGEIDALVKYVDSREVK